MNYNISKYKYGCEHYTSNCLIYTECCKYWFNCTKCHNDSNCNKKLDVNMVTKMKCLSCKIIQNISNTCYFCDTIIGLYTCIKCKLFDNDGIKKKTFHCNKCNCCRIGGKENYIHCNLCKNCINKDEYTEHICLIDSKQNNCCICQIELNLYNEPVKLLLCGHMIHEICFNKYINSVYNNLKKRKKTINYTCPICKILLINKNEYIINKKNKK